MVIIDPCPLGGGNKTVLETEHTHLLYKSCHKEFDVTDILSFLALRNHMEILQLGKSPPCEEQWQPKDVFWRLSNGLEREKKTAKTTVNSSNQVGSHISIFEAKWSQISSHFWVVTSLTSQIIPIPSLCTRHLQLCAAFEFNSPWYFDMSSII